MLGGHARCSRLLWYQSRPNWPSPDLHQYVAYDQFHALRLTQHVLASLTQLLSVVTRQVRNILPLPCVETHGWRMCG